MKLLLKLLRALFVFGALGLLILVWLQAMTTHHDESEHLSGLNQPNQQ